MAANPAAADTAKKEAWRAEWRKLYPPEQAGAGEDIPPWAGYGEASPDRVDVNVFGVVHPGLYHFAPGTTVREAIRAAGGLVFNALRQFSVVRRSGQGTDGEEVVTRYSGDVAFLDLPVDDMKVLIIPGETY